MCGFIGVLGPRGKDVIGEIYDGLVAIQHRGQDAAGACTHNGRFHLKRGMGLVREIFRGENVDRLTQAILERLPEGEPLYPADYLTDQPERFFAAEMVREKLLSANSSASSGRLRWASMNSTRWSMRSSRVSSPARPWIPTTSTRCRRTIRCGASRM